ncbi:DUF1642 domain-containing protein [Streptococcus suis]|uniref:DUF1642 domain-containing protein n=1 Tax=Streptococcus suis TaxID=1307 RepID=UPI00094271E8|nr:DUF1642 domain-containing protein [Streptococcus suis]MDN2998953.1 DUF1642 domain-containing protein [Streptococcus suis]MDW8657401.1 DUF1642 domain-containing protein [Streptococcus suis]MDW8663265.1 DUF1642 domain-containing protein [Streptococcus suis]MDW8697296.1 DUF1642 domain-containing protein [Streptococcus suis]MDW8727937.1 DUF1642 domain-containing protein [Streptococcus suis]
MNKQEAIEIIEQSKIKIANRERTIFKAGEIIVENVQVDYVPLEVVVNTIDQIHEPQTVVVPKFVAEWYERNKDDLNTAIYSTITETYRKVNGENDDLLDTFEGWLVYEDNSILILIQMQFFGFEIEQEKLFTVEIAEAILTKITRRSNVQYKMLPFGNVSDVFDKAIYTTRLTEQEIKQKDERLWQFAKEVE